MHTIRLTLALPPGFGLRFALAGITLFLLISMSQIRYFRHQPRVPKSDLLASKLAKSVEGKV